MNFERFGFLALEHIHKETRFSARKRNWAVTISQTKKGTYGGWNDPLIEFGGVIAQVSLMLAYQLRTARPREQDRYTVYR